MFREKLLLRIQRAEYWTMNVDETFDVHVQRREQLVIAVRYLSQEDGIFQQVEDPVAVMDVVADIAAGRAETTKDIWLSGKNISEVVLKGFEKAVWN